MTEAPHPTLFACAQLASLHRERRVLFFVIARSVGTKQSRSSPQLNCLAEPVIGSATSGPDLLARNDESSRVLADLTSSGGADAIVPITL